MMRVSRTAFKTKEERRGKSENGAKRTNQDMIIIDDGDLPVTLTKLSIS